ncbi:archaemetzincin family Zn-dependent metalloprotease [Thermococcus sp.]
MIMKEILIISIETDRSIVNAVSSYVTRFYSLFGFSVRVLSERDVGISIAHFIKGYDGVRGQFLGRVFIPVLADIRKRFNADAILGIVDVDLYEDNLNFIFGLANPYFRASIVSLHRLKPEFYGEFPNRELLEERAIKEAMHELGHVFGLTHCSNPRCVMHFSNSIVDTDYKGKDYCRLCREKLEEKLK